MKLNVLKSLILPIVFFSLQTGICFANFSLSVRPYEGGYDLDFGKLGFLTSVASKEIIVDINSSLNKQYRVIQTLFEPLTNSQGYTVSSFNNFTVYAVRGSNRLGTVSIDQETPVSLSRNIIYTSNAQGLSDSFTLVYNLKGPLNVPAGSYRGRIGFILEAVDGNQNPITVYLNVLVQVDAQSSINIETKDGSRTVVLNSDPNKISNSDVVFDIAGVLGTQFKIYQVFSGDFLSGTGEKIDLSAVGFSVVESKKTSIVNEALNNNQQLIYTSDLGGGADNFVVSYKFLKDSVANSGSYRNNIKYLLESPANSGSFQIIGQLTSEINIEKVFDLELNTDSGSNIIMFHGIKPNDPKRSYEVMVKIKSNLGKVYQVTQKVGAPLNTKDGTVIDSKYFTMLTETLDDTKGNVKVTAKQPVAQSDTVLFVSDKKGSQDAFKVLYELAVPVDVKAGDYSTSIVYSLSEI